MDYMHISEYTDRLVKHPELLAAYDHLDRACIEERTKLLAEVSEEKIGEASKKALIKNLERTLDLADRLRHSQDPVLREEGDWLFSDTAARLNALKHEN